MTSFLNNKVAKKVRKLIPKVSIIVFSLLLIVFLLFASYLIIYREKIYPKTSIAGVNVSGMLLQEAIDTLTSTIVIPEKITLKYQDQTFYIDTSKINLQIDFTESGIKAYEYTRTGNVLYDFGNRISQLFTPKNIGLSVTFDQEELNKIISIISGQISVSPVEPKILKSNDGLSVNKGSAGIEVDQAKLKEIINTNLSFNIGDEIQIPINEIDNTLSDEEASIFLTRSEKVNGKSLSSNFEYDSFTLKDTDMFDVFNPISGYKDEAIQKWTDKVSKEVERDPQNPKFVFNGGKVTEFQPALDGIKVDKDEFNQRIKDNLIKLEEKEDKSVNFEIPVVKTQSDVSTSEINDFGIKELIGRGTSTYYHSIPGRIHNVALAANRINGTLIKPGETFSFNSTLGDVSSFTGYQQAYIINEGKTILGDGGGVCQVSSTLFRAVLNAGLPINERQAHAYRVGYYEQGSSPGFDATVYSPSPDFKFTNDTDNYILVAAITDTKNYSLIFELYGTKDGRVASVSKPVVTNVSSPPPDVYQDDPTLPAGTTKQIDYKAWGAKVTFKYVVTKGGKEIISKTFVSNYKPWAAVYLKGTGPTN